MNIIKLDADHPENEQCAPIMSNSAHNISHEEIVELQEKFREIKVTINNFLAVMMALSEMSQRRPEFSAKLAHTVLTKAPLIASSLQEFTQALNEKNNGQGGSIGGM